MIREAGGIAVLAHPWCCSPDPIKMILRLIPHGLHGIEVYRDQGKIEFYGEFADQQGLLKMGGSDFHGLPGHDETELGVLPMPNEAVHRFVSFANDYWKRAVLREIATFASNEEKTSASEVIKTSNSAGGLRSDLTIVPQLAIPSSSPPSNQSLSWSFSHLLSSAERRIVHEAARDMQRQGKEISSETLETEIQSQTHRYVVLKKPPSNHDTENSIETPAARNPLEAGIEAAEPSSDESEEEQEEEEKAETSRVRSDGSESSGSGSEGSRRIRKRRKKKNASKHKKR